MIKDTLGGFSRINPFVKDKLRRFDNMTHDFASMFELMFSEKSNVLYEVSEGYRIVKTTYGEAYDAVLRRSTALSALLEDTEPGSVVGIYLENGPDWIITLWSVLRAGFRPLLMNMRLDDATLRDALASCGAAAVISESREFGVRAIHSIGEAEPSSAPAEFGGELLVMSSGTSAHVKLCAYGAEEFYHQIRDSLDIILKCGAMKKHWHGELKQLDFLPFYHIFGLTAVYIWFAFFSRTFVHLNDLAPQTIVNTIRRHAVTHIFAVPLFWEKVYEQAMQGIADRGEKTLAKFRRGLALSGKIGGVPLLGPLFRKLAFKEVRDNLFGDSISFMITGGSVIPARVIVFFNGIGYRLANGYGMSETGITSVELSDSVRVRDSRSVGKPMSSVTYSIGEGGELLVSGCSTAKYIIEDGIRRERAELFGTRDLAEERGGRWFILGRRDDLVISPTGENLNPNIIEQRFDIDGAENVCLIGADGGRTPVLLVGIGRGASPAKAAQTEAAVRARISELGLASEIKKTVLIADRLIAPDEFKLNRRRLAADFDGGALPVYDPEARRELPENDPLCTEILEIFALAVGKDAGDIAYTADFFLDLGGTSLDYFAMISQLRERYGIDFPTEAGKSLGSVKELYEYVKASE